jgi:glycosyltransferase involved in cell wall biosynthesis
VSTGLKIALLCDWFFPRWGGIEQHMIDLAHALQRRGHTVEVITCFPGPDDVEGVRVLRLNGFRFPYFGFTCSLTPFKELKRILLHERYDLVHIHTSYIAPLAWGGAYVSQRIGIPTLMTFHSMLAGFLQVIRWLDRTLHWSRWRVKFTAVSEAVREELQGLIPRPLILLPNGTDVAFWKANLPIQSPHPGLTVISVMRFSPRKRGAELVRLFYRCCSGLPPALLPLHLVLIGDGRLRGQIQFIICRLKLQNAVTLTGYLSRPAIRDAFAQADIFVLPGEVEAFGLSALEARSAGLPVIAHARGGARSFIRHEAEGLLADSDDDLIACLQRLVLDAELRRSITTHNRQTWPEYDWSKIVQRHEQIYRETIQAYASC